ncbi:hypothetical protein PsorP6_005468 [Peronosclerospora sorghi]|uniref:Uncharacterized protein n=1 Tax=Peronosclerospora sorghi TaxID=230839 RepID=A0ACC0W5U3_9STRA|nr:hypothetical protein PsorP6_005468 [Peronosclerospora sorghi]
MTPPQSPQSTPRTPSTPYKLDDVSGWKALESSLLNPQGNRRRVPSDTTERHGGDDEFVYLTPLVDLVTRKSFFHINRHHRTSVGDMLNQCIKRGIKYNWCQVRYAASIAARTFLLKLKPAGRAAYMPTLLPRLCLNRYYIAERVQKYSQESWQLIFGTHGRDLVATYATEFVDYYFEMANHFVRESACHCIAELGTKVGASAIRPHVPHVPRLLQSLLLCFYDVSNLVRDVACLVSAQLVLGFQDEARPFLEDFYRLWIEHLAVPIWSVREDAAVALGNVIRAYGQ